ncbi:hypothetical protein CABS01_06257 [Colletotrichum abscissum]|uniref:2EXR domain-containing protein n=1 Tax=Colletotrichum abscissum TaxID=1671311 RepID=A0A9P9X6U9_9PEZI|nr:uncharacterized protein CABS01_06257 [Colletotrichum abscissum]KAI3539671.1 hypothetical protein CABS02_11335 [Colletotrichum abscissum]KAK1516290.1 hypothetical protein CABS01_06257 [Colletotrichum abscissum]
MNFNLTNMSSSSPASPTRTTTASPPHHPFTTRFSLSSSSSPSNYPEEPHFSHPASQQPSAAASAQRISSDYGIRHLGSQQVTEKQNLTSPPAKLLRFIAVLTAPKEGHHWRFGNTREHRREDASTGTRAPRPTHTAMAPDANSNLNGVTSQLRTKDQNQDGDQQQQLKKKWKKIWLKGLSVRIRSRKDSPRAAGATATSSAVPPPPVNVGGETDQSVERGTQTATRNHNQHNVRSSQSRTLRHSGTLAHPSESDAVTDSGLSSSTAATSASHSPATSTTAQTTAVPSSSSSSSSTSLSVSVGASIGNFPSSSAPCPTCGQRRHVDLHRPPTPVKPEDRFQFRSGVPYGPWTITHPPPGPPPTAAPSQISFELPVVQQVASCCSAETPGPLTAFHPFARLPPELRSKILRFYLERPRIVEIRCMNDLKKIHFAPNALGNLASNIAWSADNTLPALMWVNRECRAETRAFYRVQLPMHPTNKIAWPVIINPDFDTVIFTFPWSSEIPLDIFLSDCLAFDPLGVGIRHFGTRDRGGPETWDLTPVPGCAPLAESLANLESYTEAIQLMDDRAAARFPVWMIHEGYLTSGIPAKNAFYRDVPRLLLSNDYEPPDAMNQRTALEALRTQLGDYLPKNVAENLVMQRMFYRKYFRHLRMKCTKTDLAGLGMVRQIPDCETEEFFLSNGREVAGPRKKRRSVLDVRPSSSWHLWDDD